MQYKTNIISTDTSLGLVVNDENEKPVVYVSLSGRVIPDDVLSTFATAFEMAYLLKDPEWKSVEGLVKSQDGDDSMLLKKLRILIDKKNAVLSTVNRYSSE